jgi:hypothetical protein
VYVPVAVNCSVVRSTMVGLAGVTAIETSAAGVTVKLVDPEIAPKVAVMVTAPWLTELANPLEPDALLIEATPVLEELQVTAVVSGCVELSVYVPVAAKLRPVPFAMLGFAGITAMETRAAGVTVKPVEPEIVPNVAVMVTAPWLAELARPLEPDALLIDATLILEELQVAELVRSCVVLSVYVPVAANCRLVPFAMLGFAGITAMETSAAGVTVKTVEPETVPNVAVMVTAPCPIELASPLEPDALLMAATLVSDDPQVTVAVRFCVELSVYVPVAAN